MILIGFRHGLRVSELCDLQWSSIEFETGTIHVRRTKGGEAATHPLLGEWQGNTLVSATNTLGRLIAEDVIGMVLSQIQGLSGWRTAVAGKRRRL
jgi:integrase